MDAPLMQGRLVRGFGGFYVAVDAQGQEHILRCKKKFRRMRLSPLAVSYTHLTLPTKA